ncbi:DsbA family oxidoreductase [Aeromicrobium terrae]|uniref:DsbA family oxidoreductase n=2 Tax=Aeromicrobium terrae TaxID=2498846 RepID=A0A5C8NNZ7_9ACTN|nr:DsbA family oxidoreductase [Aeromicrobium terrae]
MDMTLKVDIWSDIACPWCYVGKRRFESAVEEFEGDVEVEYHSFELAPDTPVDFEGSESDFLALHKRVPRPQAEQMLAQMTQLAETVGLHYDYDALQHTNTRLAHQALHLAKAHGKQVELKERLLKAYFEEGRHVGRVEDLADLAAEVGLDRELVVDALTDGTYAAAVDADIAQAWEYGIGGVPFFVLDGRFGVSGAQEPEVFLRALRKASEDAA